MDSARTRFQTAEKHSLQASSNNNFNAVGKVDNLKEELEEASQKVEQCRDTLATEMFSLISKEPQLAQLFLHFHQLQAAYHRNALTALEAALPMLENSIDDFSQKPVYGCALEEHLRVTNRDVAQVIETCVLFLLDYGIQEEGLLRIAGSASKLKKIKSAFDAGIELDMIEYVRDPHAISGAFKSYLRELPEPLLTSALYPEWMNAAKIPDFESKLQALWQVLHQLPEVNYKNLKYVVKFLSKVHESVDVNKMSSQNIAIVMAPNLIWSPTEECSTIGMNMTTASLHTSIIDLFISYADWFFSEEGDSSVLPQMSCPILPNLNESESLGNEVNGNNLEVYNSSSNIPCPSSPRSPNKNSKKPVAPPPPAQKATPDIRLPPAAGELIDLSSGDFFLATKEEDTSKLAPHPKEVADRCSSIDELQKKANEYLDSASNEFAPPTKNEKPIVPDKPNYSSCSLDRKLHRQSANMSRHYRTPGVPTKTPEVMSRSHIERPSVPPPERPTKPPKFPSSENLSSGDFGKSKKDSESGVISSLNSCQPQETDLEDSVVVPKAEHSPLALRHSKSVTKMNRFDFLVNQRDEKPPERPPRSVVPTTDFSLVVGPETKHETSTTSLVTGSESEYDPPTAPQVSPRPTEVEKTKPPRPQPPLPVKPKLFLQSENTNL